MPASVIPLPKSYQPPWLMAKFRSHQSRSIRGACRPIVPQRRLIRLHQPRLAPIAQNLPATFTSSSHQSPNLISEQGTSEAANEQKTDWKDMARSRGYSRGGLDRDRRSRTRAGPAGESVNFAGIFCILVRSRVQGRTDGRLLRTARRQHDGGRHDGRPGRLQLRPRRSAFKRSNRVGTDGQHDGRMVINGTRTSALGLLPVRHRTT